MGLSVLQIAVGGYDDNFSYLVYDTKTKQAVAIDPCGDLDLILETADVHELAISGVLLTHTHFDHTDQLAELLRSYTVPVHVHEQGADVIVSSGPIEILHDNDSIKIADNTVTVLYTPGHMRDAICYYVAQDEADDHIPKLVTGDTLFVEGCGRTNVVGVKALYDSLQRLKSLPPETEVYPGHDYGSKPHSTIAWECEHNKYFLAKNFEEFEKLRLKA